MKLKYNFVVRKVNDRAVAVAVGDDCTKFNGMVKLNPTGEFVFNMLNTGDVSMADIVAAVIEKYDVDEKTATDAVSVYVDSLRKSGLIEE